MAQPEINPNFHGLVDMGSNGIRFSITDLSHQTARSLPTVYTSRSGISLYDAQFPSANSSSAPGTRQPIPAATISSVISAFRAFKSTCHDFGVLDPGNITILATEATRTAPNSKEFISEIKKQVGWDVKLLAKEEEGRVGACGIASSFEEVVGLVMDLGGGSTQITWMIARDGHVQTSPKGSFSFPYGAAAMIRRLDEIETLSINNSRESTASIAKAKDALSQEIQSNFRNAFGDLSIPPELLARAEDQGGLSLYLSGGGFRGWGYLLMSESDIVQPYPIPIINGFSVDVSAFRNTMRLQFVASTSLSSLSDKNASTRKSKIFRVSKRRAAQVPAVAFLINNLLDALPPIKAIHFCQGGVREGYFFDSLPPELRSQSPLVAASSPHAPPSTQELAALISSALPPSHATTSIPMSVTSLSLILSLAQSLYLHAPHPKETAALSALYYPITGPLASAHGISHQSRALLSLLLCDRWCDSPTDDLPPPHDTFHAHLCQLLTPDEVWWARYLGRVSRLIATVYPAGAVRDGDRRLELTAKWEEIEGKKGIRELGIGLHVLFVGERTLGVDSYLDAIQGIEKMGKKKNRMLLSGRGGAGGLVGVGLTVEIRMQDHTGQPVGWDHTGDHDDEEGNIGSD